MIGIKLGPYEILEEVGRHVHIPPKVAEAYKKLML